MPPAITELIQTEIDNRIQASIKGLASEVCEQYASGGDLNRRHELETQLRQGLVHLARRINEGAQVEINVGIISVEKPGPNPEPEIVERIAEQKKRLEQLRKLRSQARSVSASTIHIERHAPLLLDNLTDSDESNSA